jgi:hypothetical protein
LTSISPWTNSRKETGLIFSFSNSYYERTPP